MAQNTTISARFRISPNVADAEPALLASQHDGALAVADVTDCPSRAGERGGVGRDAERSRSAMAVAPRCDFARQGWSELHQRISRLR
jgi:hypothetical protein